MARPPRLYVTDCSHHVIQLGNNRDACFYEKEHAFYLQQLKVHGTVIKSV